MKATSKPTTTTGGTKKPVAATKKPLVSKKQFKNAEIEKQNQKYLERINAIKTKKRNVKEEQKTIDLMNLRKKNIEAAKKNKNKKIEEENNKILEKIQTVKGAFDKEELERQYIKDREVYNNILRFHELKEKVDPEYDRVKRIREKLIEEEEKIELGDRICRRIYLWIKLKSLEFSNIKFQPNPKEKANESYFMKIQACYKGLRQTLPEKFEDFSKSILNEFFNMNQLAGSKLLKIEIYKKYLTKLKKETDLFCGSFVIDLTQYFEVSDEYDLTYEIKNTRLYTVGYLPEEFQTKAGKISFTLKVTKDIDKIRDQTEDENLKDVNAIKKLDNIEQPGLILGEKVEEIQKDQII